jgi:hypothetical protein
MVINYRIQYENAAWYGKIFGVDALWLTLISKYLLLRGNSGPMSTTGKPHPIPIALHL